MIRLADPLWLVMLIPVWGWAVWSWRKRFSRVARLSIPSIGALRIPRTPAEVLSSWQPWLRALGLTLLVVSIARPQSGASLETVHSEGVDIVISLDNSPSMKAEDFQPQNRLGVAKRIVRDFVTGRVGDRIGLVVFARIATTRCPRTLDHDLFVQIVDELDFAPPEDGATAIGLGLGSALNLLRDSEAESRVVVLVTDGRNNAGELPPRAAAEIATSLGIRVYTIGVGKDGPVPLPISGPRGVVRREVRLDLDEPLLKEIAERTGGQYFRATDADTLQEIFDTIDELETVEIESEIRTLYSERFSWVLWPGLLLLLLERGLWDTRLGRIP